MIHNSQKGCIASNYIFTLMQYLQYLLEGASQIPNSKVKEMKIKQRAQRQGTCVTCLYLIHLIVHVACILLKGLKVSTC